MIFLGHDTCILLGGDVDLSEGMFFEEKLELAPIVISSALVLGVFEGMHRDSSGFVSWDNLGNEEAIAHIFAVIFDGIGEIEPLHPFEDLPG